MPVSSPVANELHGWGLLISFMNLPTEPLWVVKSFYILWNGSMSDSGSMFAEGFFGNSFLPRSPHNCLFPSLSPILSPLFFLFLSLSLSLSFKYTETHSRSFLTHFHSSYINSSLSLSLYLFLIPLINVIYSSYFFHPLTFYLPALLLSYFQSLSLF